MREGIRVGVIGRRFGAQVHVPAFESDSRCVVAAVAGRDDWSGLVADRSIDAISIAVPPREQPAIITEAARRGKHVFCEKPVAATLADAECALRSVTAAGVAHAIDFIFPETAAWQQARARLAAGAIGAPRHFAYSWRVETYAARMQTDSWKNRADAGGGAAGNFLPHVLFNLEWLLGRIVRLDRSQDADRRSAMRCDGVATLESGMTGPISVATDAYLGSGHRLEVFGESGTLVLQNTSADYVGGFELYAGTRASGRLEALVRSQGGDGADGRIGAVAQIVHRFIDAIGDRGTVRPNLADGVRVQRLVDPFRDVDAD